MCSMQGRVFSLRDVIYMASGVTSWWTETSRTVSKTEHLWTTDFKSDLNFQNDLVLANVFLKLHLFLGIVLTQFGIFSSCQVIIPLESTCVNFLKVMQSEGKYCEVTKEIETYTASCQPAKKKITPQLKSFYIHFSGMFQRKCAGKVCQQRAAEATAWYSPVGTSSYHFMTSLLFS